MAINFPNSPSVDDTHTVGTTTWTWDGTSWNAASGAGAGSSIDDLSDVDTSTTTPNDGEILIYNATDGEWEPGTMSGGPTLTKFTYGGISTSSAAPTSPDSYISFYEDPSSPYEIWMSLSNLASGGYYYSFTPDVGTGSFTLIQGYNATASSLSWVRITNTGASNYSSHGYLYIEVNGTKIEYTIGANVGSDVIDLWVLKKEY